MAADRALPSLLKHFAAALIVLALVALAVWALLQTEPPSPPEGRLTLPERIAPPAADSLMADTDESVLPDLLAGVVDVGANPTEAYVDPDPPPGDNSTPEPQVISLDGVAKPDPLPPAPIEALQTRSSYGFVPIVAENGRTAFEAYRRPDPDVSGAALSIVVGGLGINPEMTRRAIESLPPEITLGFAAHAPGLQAQIDRAREYGHEVVLELPMESDIPATSEPYADRMLRAGAVSANLQNLDYLLSRAGGYFAVVPYGGERFLSRADSAAPVLSKIADSGIGFVSDPQLRLPTLTATAQAAGLRFRKGTMLIDADPSPDAIRADLVRLRDQADGRVRPVGFGFAYPATIDALIAFDPGDATLVPLSAAFR